jgi:hypothetical protein
MEVSCACIAGCKGECASTVCAAPQARERMGTTNGRQLVAFCCVGNKHCCHRMELHIMTVGESDKQAREERQNQLAVTSNCGSKCKKQESKKQ